MQFSRNAIGSVRARRTIAASFGSALPSSATFGSTAAVGSSSLISVEDELHELRRKHRGRHISKRRMAVAPIVAGESAATAHSAGEGRALYFLSSLKRVV